MAVVFSVSGLVTSADWCQVDQKEGFKKSQHVYPLPQSDRADQLF